jgi:hypothetical protein
VVKLSAVLGDSYVLAHCPVQYAAMRTQVAHDLASLEARCDKVVIVAHSQGAAIAHQVLKDGAYSKERLQAFITLGQGISKLHLLRRMDWDPQASRAAFWTRLLVTIGLLCAGLPALGILLSRWINATILELAARFPANLVLIVAGFLPSCWALSMQSESWEMRSSTTSCFLALGRSSRGSTITPAQTQCRTVPSRPGL